MLLQLFTTAAIYRDRVLNQFSENGGCNGGGEVEGKAKDVFSMYICYLEFNFGFIVRLSSFLTSFSASIKSHSNR